MLELNCYKMVRQAKMFSEAELACRSEAADLAKPITLLQVATFSSLFIFFKLC
jgi:hypothetical protein